jgi:prephenate dehydratase
MQLRVGTLGSATTFAGEATAQLCRRRADFADARYFATMDACWDELARGTVDVVVLSAERTGQPHHAWFVVDRGFSVMDRIAVPLGCNLYVKRGAAKRDVRAITGHGAIHLCTAFLDREFPGIAREVHGQNSVEAARAVASGDGSLAVVGSASLPSQVAGLELSAAQIDGGAICSWWAVSREPHHVSDPTVAIVAAELGPDGRLGTLADALGGAGFGLSVAASFPVTGPISTYRYLLEGRGAGTLAGLQRALAAFPQARLAGAFRDYV